MITQPGSLSISGAGTDVLCNGGTTGIIMVQATSGTAPYTFAITPAGTQSNPTADSAVFTGLAAGTYTVTVTDAGGCTAEIDVMVMEPGALAMNLSSIGLTCNGNASGTATANVIGGVQGVTMQAQGMLTVSTDNTGFFADETSYQLIDASNNVVLSGGPFGFGAITLSSPVVASNGPYTLNVSTLGFFNDNFTNWAVMCNGNPIASGCLEGTVYGGAFVLIPDLYQYQT
ncbi:MAG: SprB repeat-containing protein [Bacteroidetes bacterium]|nr:SprB repeat-containing protein [Bacteroidota bacterium]